MNWVEAHGSSNIARFAYDDANCILVVQFISGGTYNYYDVPEIVFNQMKNAPSRGQFLARNIKGVYRYARV